jgi:hypothetical protein
VHLAGDALNDAKATRAEVHKRMLVHFRKGHVLDTIRPIWLQVRRAEKQHALALGEITMQGTNAERKRLVREYRAVGLLPSIGLCAEADCCDSPLAVELAWGLEGRGLVMETGTETDWDTAQTYLKIVSGEDKGYFLSDKMLNNRGWRSTAVMGEATCKLMLGVQKWRTQLEEDGKLPKNASAAQLRLALHKGMLYDRYKMKSVLAHAMDFIMACRYAESYQLVLRSPLLKTEKEDRAEVADKWEQVRKESQLEGSKVAAFLIGLKSGHEVVLRLFHGPHGDCWDLDIVFATVTQFEGAVVHAVADAYRTVLLSFVPPTDASSVCVRDTHFRSIVLSVLAGLPTVAHGFKMQLKRKDEAVATSQQPLSASPRRSSRRSRRGARRCSATRRGRSLRAAARSPARTGRGWTCPRRTGRACRCRMGRAVAARWSACRRSTCRRVPPPRRGRPLGERARPART